MIFQDMDGANWRSEERMNDTQVVHTVKVHSGTSTGCPFCKTFLHGERTDESINHLVQEHQGRLLHVGSEYGMDGEGATVHFTVAMVGFSEPPPKRDPELNRFAVHRVTPKRKPE